MNDSSVAAAIVAVTFAGTVPSTTSPPTTATHGALGDPEEGVVRSLTSVVGQGQVVGPRTLVD